MMNAKDLVKVDILLYTETLKDVYVEKYGEDFSSKMVSEHIEKHSLVLQQYISNTDSSLNVKMRYAGPYATSIDETGFSDRDLHSSLETLLQDPMNPLAQKVNAIQLDFGVSTVRIVLFSNNGMYTTSGSNILVTGPRSGNANESGFISSVTDLENANTTVKGYGGVYTSEHPLDGNRYYTLLSVSSSIPVFPKDGFYRDEYGYLIRVGDEEHNVLDPDTGWKLENVFDMSGTDLGFQTQPDTLTILEDVERNIRIFPGWNDDNIGEVLYVGGSSINIRRDLHPDERHVDYKSKVGQFYPETNLTAYAVAINGIEDAFAMDYILVKFVESLEIPTIDPESLPDSIRVGETFTVSLQGDVDLMTSWMPTFESSNSNIELVSVSKSSATFKAVARGKVDITLSHKNALRQDIDETTTEIININSDIQKPLAPDSLQLDLKNYSHILTWNEVSNALSYNVYFKYNDSEIVKIATELESTTYTDEVDIEPGLFWYVVTAINEAGESSYSNEVFVIYESVFEELLENGTSLKLTPNPAETITYLSFNLKQPQSNITIKLIDLQGKTHSEYKIQGKTINHPLNIESLPTGSYLLQIQIEQYHQTIPLIKTPKTQ